MSRPARDEAGRGPSSGDDPGRRAPGWCEVETGLSIGADVALDYMNDHGS